MKYIVGLFLLLFCHALLAQESVSVKYNHSRIYTCIRQEKNKKSARKIPIKVVFDKEVDLIYSPTYLALKSPKGVDTIFLSTVNETVRELFIHTISIKCNNNADFINLAFDNERDVKIAKRFMRENGWHFKRKTGRKIVESIVNYTIFLALLAIW